MFCMWMYMLISEVSDEGQIVSETSNTLTDTQRQTDKD